MATSVGVGYISIVPEVKGFAAALQTQTGAAGALVGQKIGQDVSSGLQKSAPAMKAAGMQMSMALTLPLAAVGVASMNAAADFEKSMNMVAAATDAPAAEMDKLTDLAKQMGAETQFSALEAGQAMLELAKGGISTANIQAGALKSTMSLAAAGEMDLAEAAIVTTGAMNTFGLTAADSASIADSLAGAANASAADVSDLSLSLQQVGQQAAASGLTVQETTAGLAAFADAGLKGSDAGTSMKTMLQRLAAPTTTASGVMKELGLDFFDASGNMVGLSDIAGQLQVGLKDLTQEQRLQALQTMFGSDSLRAANILFNEGASGIEEYIGKTSEVGAAQKMADAAMQGTSGALEKMKGSLETAGIAIGNAMAPAVVKLAGLIEVLANWFTALPGPVQTAVVVLGGLLAIAGPMLWIIGTMVTTMGVVGPAFASASAGVWSFTAALLANPITWIVLAVIALIAAIWLLWQNIDTVKSWLSTAWDWIKSTAIACFELLKQAWQALWDFYFMVLSTIWNAIVTALTTYWTVLTTVWSAIWNAITTVLSTVWNTIVTIVQTAWNIVTTLITTQMNIITTIFTTAWSIVSGVFTTAWNLITGVVTTQINIVKSIIETAWNAVKSLTTTIWDGIKNGIQTAINTVKSVIQTALNIVQNIWNNTFGRMRDIIVTVADKIKSVVNTMASVIQAAIDRVKAAIASVIQALASVPVVGAVMGALGMASGGLVPGSGNSDTVPIMGTPGEYMLTRQQVSQVGSGALDNWRMGGPPPGGGGGGITVQNLNVNNPVAEPTSDSLPRAMRSLAYVGVG